MPRNRQVQGGMEEMSELARHSTGGGPIVGLISALALIFSGISLYQTVLKRPSLRIYVPPVIHYTRDANGNYEVFAIPITIANVGARDGAVLSISLTGRRPKGGGKVKAFYSAYFVDAGYFSQGGASSQASEGIAIRTRPKEPFAPISVAGRSSFSGTILFYPRSGSSQKLVDDKGDYRLTLTLDTHLDVGGLGFFDRLVQTVTTPITFTVRLPHFSESDLLRGETARMHNVVWASSTGETLSKRRP